MNRAVLCSSFAIVLSREHHLATRFYDKLLTRHPELAPLFHNRGRQEKMLARALVAVLDRIDQAPWLEEQLAGLGRRHVGYGVSSEMYPWFGVALLETMADVLGRDWTPEVAAAWSEAWADLSALMLRSVDDPHYVERANAFSEPTAGP